MQILINSGGTYTKPIDAQARLEPPPDSQVQGDALDNRQHQQTPEKVLSNLRRLAERQQDSAAAVKAFARNGTPQLLQDVANSAIAVGQQGHLLEAGLREFAVLGLVDTLDARMFSGNTLAQLRTLAVPVPLTQEVLNQTNSSSDFFDQLLGMIGLIRGEYLAVYEELLKKYSDFYKDFNNNIMAKMSEWIASQPDGKNIELNFLFVDALQSLLSKYSAHPAGTLFPIPDKDGKTPIATKAEAEKWAIALGMGEKSPNVVELPDGGGFIVRMDLSPVRVMTDQLLEIFSKGTENGKTNIDSAKFQAWQTGFNSQEGELKNQLQMFTTKYGNANSYHENFNKILSSQLSQYAEMLKAITSGIA